MSNLLVLYEIADRATRVKTKKAYKEFERWLAVTLEKYQDEAIQRVAKVHLFKLKEQLALSN